MIFKPLNIHILLKIGEFMWILSFSFLQTEFGALHAANKMLFHETLAPAT